MKTIKSFNKRLGSLRSERSTFVPYWEQLSDNFLYHRGRFLTSDRNKGYKRNTKMYNNSPRMSARTLASGMMAGITSPARPWFRLSAPDPELNQYHAVRQWLHEVQVMMYAVFSASNVYSSLHTTYGELGTFGVGALGIYEDFESVIVCKSYTVGSYFLGINGQDRVDTFYREYERTVGELVTGFGLENCSNHVKDQWEKGNTEAPVKVIYAVEPNDTRDKQSMMARDMKFRSVYYEDGRQCLDENKFLKESGFEEFPVLTPRWDVTCEDIYATDCPGMMALGDAKSLQLGERRMYQALDKLTNPPLQGPTSLKNKVGRTLRDGEVVYTDEEKGLRSIYDSSFRPDLNAIVEINRLAETRIKTAFYEDLFLMLSQSDRRQITAREVAEKHEEKLLMLGPVLERLHSELLDPLINRTFSIMQRSGILPVPPPELDNVDLRVEYVSVLAQAQQLVSVGAIERVAGFTGELASIWPEARHKFNAMKAVDDFAEAVGVSPNMIRSDDDANGMAQAEQQAAQQAAQAEQMAAAAQTAKTASETDLQGDTGLSAIMRGAGLA